MFKVNDCISNILGHKNICFSVVNFATEYFPEYIIFGGSFVIFGVKAVHDTERQDHRHLSGLFILMLSLISK
jgi:hypothetical protein